MWAQLTDEQKKTYGEDYYEAAMTSLEKHSREVIDTFYLFNKNFPFIFSKIFTFHLTIFFFL